MIKLLNLNKTVVRYLPKYRDLSVTEELKTGDQTLTFTLLEHNPSDIANEWYIETADARYVIKETEKTMDDYPSYTCQLDLEDLEQTMFEQFTAANKTAAQAAALAIAGTGWTVTSTMTKKRSVQSFKLTPLQALGKIRDAFMCDLWFDSLNRVVHLEEERGEDRGVYFLAGLNLKDLKTTVDNYDYYTRLIPIGKDDLRINAVNAGVGYVENYQYSNKIRTLIWEDTSYEDANILKEDAIAKLADLSKPKKSYKASVRDLAKQKPGYSILSYALGDTVTIADRSTGTRDAQRIVKLVRYPDSPEKNTCELSNTVLTFEEQQDRLNAAAAAWESVSNTDGTVNGVWVHGVRAGDVVGVEVTTGGSATTTDLNNAVSIMQGDTAAVVSDLQAATARIGTIEATYLTAASAALTYATITNLDASNARISAIEADYLTATNAALTYATITNLEAATARISTIEADYLTATNAALTYATIQNLNAATARISTIEADYLTAESAALTYLTAADAALTYATITNLNAATARIGAIEADYLTATTAAVTYATVNLANVVAGSIKTAMIDTGAVQTAQIADGSITDAKIVTLTANKINAGTLSVERLEIRGSNTSLVYALNNITGALQAQNVNTINGEVLTQRTVTADRIVANAITANEIAASTITGNEIAANTITAAKIAAGTITGNEIAASTITAGKLSVTTLSAITANMGTITGGLLQLGTNAVTELKNDGTGHIGAWNFDATKLYNGTYGSDNSVYFSTANMSSKAIGGRTGSDWRLTIGSKFGVTNTGAVYSNALYATGGEIGGWEIAGTSLNAITRNTFAYLDAGGAMIMLASHQGDEVPTENITLQYNQVFIDDRREQGYALLRRQSLMVYTTGMAYSEMTPTSIIEGGTALSSKYALKSVVDELNTNLSVKSGSLTQASGQSLSSSLTIRQSGHVIAVFGFINNVSIPTTATIDIGIIGNVSLPANAVRTVGSVGANAYSMGAPSYIVIGTDGKLSVRTSATGSNMAIFFNATWIV